MLDNVVVSTHATCSTRQIIDLISLIIVKSANYEAPRYVIFYILLLSLLSQNISLKHCSQAHAMRVFCVA